MAKQNTTTQFLEAHKRLERTLLQTSKTGMTVLDYESTLPVGRQEKLRLCRIVRNWLVHNPDSESFIEPSTEMTEFLATENNIALSSTQTLKDCAERITPIKPETTIRQACKLFDKYPQRTWLPAVDKDGRPSGVLTSAHCLRAAIKAASLDETPLLACISKTELKRSLQDIAFADISEPASVYVKKDRHAIVTRKDVYYGLI